MSGMARGLRQALTVARRDFKATVFAPTFLIFLLSPLLTLAFGAMGGLGASSMADSAVERVRLVILADPTQVSALTAVDHRLRRIYHEDDAPPALQVLLPGTDPAADARKMIDDGAHETTAVLYGPLDAPTVLYDPSGRRSADYLAEVAEQTLRAGHWGGPKAIVHAHQQLVQRKTLTQNGHNQAAIFSVVGIFMMTLFLAGLTIGTMAEERNNKVIEVLAAAIPLESVFLGKLIGMFGVAFLFIAFWGTIVSQGVALLPPSIAAGIGSIAPATGEPMFAILFVIYFMMAFLLIGALYLILGAQASTQRELQMMSLPMTFVQMGLVGLAAAGAVHPGSTMSLIAEILPFSSPMAMAARAANAPSLWPHLLAILWQLAWLALVLWIGARAFRRGVLQSGSAKFSFRTLFARG
jgi:ABC-2 type transport system permease protein